MWGQRPGQPGGSTRIPARAAGVVLAALLAASVLLAGCEPGIVDAPVKPLLKPPAIVKAGELIVAADLDYPPFAGKIEGRAVGLDVDVASALADRFGLKLTLVDATPAEAARMLRERKIDLVLGGMTIDDALTNDVAFAGAYAESAPAIFSTKPGTATLETMGGAKVAVQKGSAAFWVLTEEYGADFVVGYPTLKEAMQAATIGQVTYVGADAVVGLYMLREFPRLHLAGQLAPATPLGAGVSKDSPDFELAVRQALDRLAAQGALQTLRRKWLGDAPRLRSSMTGTDTI